MNNVSPSRVPSRPTAPLTAEACALTLAATDPNVDQELLAAALDSAARIETLRTRLQHLGEELQTCKTPAEWACVTKAIQVAEVDLWHAKNLGV